MATLGSYKPTLIAASNKLVDVQYLQLHAMLNAIDESGARVFQGALREKLGRAIDQLNLVIERVRELTVLVEDQGR